MDMEQKQEELIDHFVKQASSLTGAALAALVSEATSHPSLFAFSEILSVPSLLQCKIFNPVDMTSPMVAVEYDVSKSLLFVWISLKEQRILCTWMCFVCLRMAHGVITRVLPYDQLMQQLDVANVRELEDFLINECMYAGIVRGKLDQLRKCFEVQFAAGRDPRPEQLGSMIETLSNWLVTSDNLLISIQEKMSWADKMSELNKKHKKEIEDKAEEVKRTYSLKLSGNLISVEVASEVYIEVLYVCTSEVPPCKQADNDFRGHEEIYSEPGGVMDYEEDRSRPKR
ncbi:hypothetical protein ACLB2K_077011 [Fragaria x ananassa]